MTDPRTNLARRRADEPRLKADFAVCSLALFGSGARGEAGPASDVDLRIEFDHPIGLLHVSCTAMTEGESSRRRSLKVSYVSQRTS